MAGERSVPVLNIAPDSDFQYQLEGVFQRTRIDLAHANTVGQARAILLHAERPFRGVIVYDSLALGDVDGVIAEVQGWALPVVRVRVSHTQEAASEDGMFVLPFDEVRLRDHVLSIGS